MFDSLYEICRIGSTLNSRVSLDRWLETIAHRLEIPAIELFQCRDSNEFVRVAGAGKRIDLFCEKSLSDREKTAKASLSTNEVVTNPLPGIESYTCIPLNVFGKRVGVVAVASIDNLTKDKLKALEIVSDEIGLYLEVISLKESNLKAEAELQALAQIHDLGRARLPLHDLLDGIVKSMMKTIGADAGAIQLVEGDQFVVRGARGLKHDIDQPLSIGLDEGIAGKVRQELKPVIVRDAYHSPDIANPSIIEAKIKTILAVPVISDSAILGVVQVDFLSERNFTVSDINHFRKVVDWAAAAIERSRLDSEIDRSKDALKDLTSKLTDRLESERRRLSRELHDQAGQSLTAILIRLDLVTDLISDPAIKQQLQQIEMLAVGTVDELRRLSRDLRPAVLDDLGLEEALGVLASTLSGGALGITLIVEKPFPRLPEAIETTLYRIAQEALNNVIKHAQATVVAVRLQHNSKTVQMEVKDNGIGFDIKPDENSAVGIGLIGMKERCDSLRGKLTIESLPEKGTRIRVEIPL